jgi:hypothetical protein
MFGTPLPTVKSAAALLSTEAVQFSCESTAALDIALYLVGRHTLGRLLRAPRNPQLASEHAAADELLFRHLTAVATRTPQLLVQHRFALVDLCTSAAAPEETLGVAVGAAKVLRAVACSSETAWLAVLVVLKEVCLVNAYRANIDGSIAEARASGQSSGQSSSSTIERSLLVVLQAAEPPFPPELLAMFVAGTKEAREKLDVEFASRQEPLQQQQQQQGGGEGGGDNWGGGERLWQPFAFGNQESSMIDAAFSIHVKMLTRATMCSWQCTIKMDWCVEPLFVDVGILLRSLGAI